MARSPRRAGFAMAQVRLCWPLGKGLCRCGCSATVRDGGLVMAAYLEVWTLAGRELVALEAGRMTLGTDPANDLALPADPTLSRLHAVLERYEAGWCVRDLDSRNGTFVNGQRVWRERPLRPGDELRVGTTRLVFRSDEAAVKQHLAHLYDKFGVHGGGERRRVRLANEALRRGAVTIAGLREAVARNGKQNK